VNKYNLTEDQLKVYKAVEQMRLKRTVTLVFLAVFVAAFIFLIVSFCVRMPVSTSIITGSFDVLLTPTTYLMSKHFFASVNATNKIDD